MQYRYTNQSVDDRLSMKLHRMRGVLIKKYLGEKHTLTLIINRINLYL